jgi:hypothetical protein
MTTELPSAGVPLTNEYFIKLGRFIQIYSQAETCLHLIFHDVAKLDPSVGNVVKRDATASALCEMLKRLIVVNDFSTHIIEDFHACIAQFRVVGEFRNRLIHRGARANEDGIYSSTNTATMRSIEAFEISSFTVENIEHATSDLERLTLRLFDCVDGTKGSRPADATQVLFSPWLFKSIVISRPNQPPKSGGAAG